MPTLFLGIAPALVACVACFAFGVAFPAQAEEERPIIQEWQKKGLLAALNDPSAEVFKSTILHSARQDEIAATLHAVSEALRTQVSKIGELLRDNDAAVRSAAVQALLNVGAKEQALAIAEWLKDEDSAVRMHAIEALGTLGAKEQAPAIVERLKDEDSVSARPRSRRWGPSGRR